MSQEPQPSDAPAEVRPGAPTSAAANMAETAETAETAQQGADLSHYERPSVTVDIVILTMRRGRLEALLVQRGRPPFKGMWAIPGGFVNRDETLEAAAQRELKEETGVHGVHVEQFHAFGDPGRDPRGWVISVAHFALVPQEQLREQQVRGGDDAAQADWFAAYEPPPLAFDHAKVLSCALERLRSGIECTPVARTLLPEVFTLRALRAVYGALCNRALDAAVFRKKMLASGMLEQAPAAGQASGRGGRALYRFRERGLE